MNHPYALFGIECEKGWESLYGPLMERCKAEGVEIFQIKEKYGELRFYTGPASEELLDAINEATRRSRRICEVCGEPGKLYTSGWWRTLCPDHARDHGGSHEDIE